MNNKPEIHFRTGQVLWSMRINLKILSVLYQNTKWALCCRYQNPLSPASAKILVRILNTLKAITRQLL